MTRLLLFFDAVYASSSTSSSSSCLSLTVSTTSRTPCVDLASFTTRRCSVYPGCGAAGLGWPWPSAPWCGGRLWLTSILCFDCDIYGFSLGTQVCKEMQSLK